MEVKRYTRPPPERPSRVAKFPTQHQLSPTRITLPNHPFSSHAMVFLGNGNRNNTRDQETQTPPLIPARNTVHIGRSLSPHGRTFLSQGTSLPARAPWCNGRISPFDRLPPTVRTPSNGISQFNGPSQIVPLPTVSASAGNQPDRRQSVENGRLSTNDRVQNDYVGAPIGRSDSLRNNDSSQPQSLVLSGDDRASHRLFCKTVSLPPESPKQNLHPNVLSSAPSCIKPVKDIEKTGPAYTHSDSVLCQRCGKCKCLTCLEPRKLPSRWICNKQVEFSADKCVECCTGVLCVRAIFYHGGRECLSDTDDNYSCSDYPCACTSKPHTFKRWLCMALMSLCLPCLCLYWPARGCVRLCTVCYDRSTRKGCRCQSVHGKDAAHSRALLDASST